MNLFKLVFTGALVLVLSACTTLPEIDTREEGEAVVEDRRAGTGGLLDRQQRRSDVEVIGMDDGQGLEAENLLGDRLGSDALVGGLLDDEAIRAFAPVVYFGYDQSTLGEDSMETLKFYSQQMLDNPRLLVTLEGHTDERGSPSYNLALGERRAQSVAEVMMLYGVTRDRITLISFGEEQPAEFGHDEAAWSKNRRVELRFN